MFGQTDTRNNVHTGAETRILRHPGRGPANDDNDQAPEALARGSNKLQAKPPKSDDGQEEQNGFVKIKELGEDSEEAQTF
ncbi:hypothetical protein D6C99_09936 [Aureobasidium pullulans]|nr:hypothetical protein D6C99_09936 [Aureobasidium pullulans]